MAALQAWAVDHDGDPPSRTQWQRCSPTHPHYARVRQLFGTWSNAIQAAGMTPLTKRVRWTDAEILELLQRWSDAHGAPVPPTGTLAHPSIPRGDS